MAIVKPRNEIDPKFKWKLEKIYASNEAFEEELSKLKEEAPVLMNYKEKLHEKESLLSYLKDFEKYTRVLEKLYAYAHMKSDEDTTNTAQQVILSKVAQYAAEYSAMVSYFVPELLSLPESVIEGYLADEDLSLYKFYIESIVKEKPHVLSKEKEELMATMSDSLNAPDDIYSMFTNADMTFSDVEDGEGTKHPMTEGSYSMFIQSKDRVLRKNAFMELFGTYGKYRNAIGTMLSSNMKTFNLKAKVRNYSGPIEASLSPNNIPVAVYDNALETISESVSSLHRYVELKKKLLKLDEIHMYDLYVPVIDVPEEKIPFEEGIALSLEGLKPLGEEYLSIFKEGVENGWIDIYENKGKRSGAYSSGAYDTEPYILLNYHEDLRDVSTLVHEMGHSIHSYYSRKHQPFVYGDYTLFVAEVASTTNEKLLIHHQIEKEQDPIKKLYLVNQELEQIRTTVFRQLMFAEFEKVTHETIQKGTPMTGEDFCSLWMDLNKKYFGENIVLDQEIEMEWARIPHFYRDFYVYQYATGYAAASAFAEHILKEGEPAVERYLGFLKTGGSNYPVETLQVAGVDMTSKEPLEATVRRFNVLLDMLEEYLNQ
ncbi:oligoendopeptidase F [Proteiniclasticum ruminis]|uniref:Oligopeptidase F n=1 Tax=Proteiniclasticum ruminis TaxID=398199 RepID=A0A1I4ZRS6_9CLOT|nr:oligoendopeptidase F [Proteiniclasticum ruminis]SFN52689.1 oligopeptidase F. Metallo peptidase. MEROPS family M03B [Proteiniclasticum ruminis]